MHIKVIFRHVMCWLLWISLTSISTIRDINYVPLWSVSFNIVSSILLFYIMYGLSCSYNKKINLAEGLNRSKGARWSYFLLKKEIAVAVGVIAAYVGGSWMMDKFFDRIGHTANGYNDIWFYMDAKFARGAFFISTGIAYGLLKVMIERKNEIIAAQKALNIITMQENALMKNTYSKRVKEMRNMVKSALANKEED